MALTFYSRLEGADLDKSTSEQFDGGCVLYSDEELGVRVMSCSIDNPYHEEQEWWDAFSFVMRDRAPLGDGKWFSWPAGHRAALEDGK